MNVEVAVIGDGVVAAFATAAAIDAGASVTVYSQRGSPTYPPQGAFYLYDVPDRLQTDYLSHVHHETVYGLELKLYTQQMWGQYLPSSIDRLFDYMSREQVPSRPKRVWAPLPALIDQMFEDATWVKGTVQPEDVDALAATKRLVVVTVPLSFVGDRPHIVKMPVLSLDALTPDSTELLALTRLYEILALVEYYKRELQSSSITIYNATPTPWLRATAMLGHVHVELPPSALDARGWLLRMNQTSAEQVATWLSAHAAQVPKLHPSNTLRNRHPASNVMLSGRWATWERHELSHTTYYRVRAALEDMAMVDDYVGV